ncbi:family 43 glycosylhydrolase [Myceligenerans pegani]|uniref:Family 43 glycosylhydrolase n=1 Tax=Myceligenerans pegani TaxID=2776917 RepID=A0ABR9N552_9MICO|nr:family 43 glycosylhydrolase [Myceligenerans sp. TRM 65318]MBE1878396.1 family 43 glycosylhydrolase [Myceligenerans sp. TRM 65318]MBE3020667.1 family 43 glycosylhydrolase [Myceligenerans sp. TRM 65318]
MYRRSARRARAAGLGCALAVTAGLVAIAPAAADRSPVPDLPVAPDAPRLVVEDDFPDPDILLVDGVYHAYATNNDGEHQVQHRTSRDLRHWTPRPDAAPGIGQAAGDWVGPCRTLPDGTKDYCVWAPEVTTVDGGYALYYTARHAASGRQCLGLATAPTPDGPFVDALGEPLVCPVGQGGAIDAGTVRDGDQLYLLWKSDGNCCAQPAIIYAQPLSADGTTLTGPPVELLRNDVPWQGAVVEAPAMVEHDGRFYLYFAANDYFGGNYRTGWAVSDSVTGPFTVSDAELLTSDDFAGEIVGPGGLDVTTHQGRPAVVFHGWDDGFTRRGMYAAGLAYGTDGVPVVGGAAVRYEAEDAVVTNASTTADPTASGLRKVGGLDLPDSSVRFTVEARRSGPHTLRVRFANGSLDAEGRAATATHALTVNGVDRGTVRYWHTQWGNWQFAEIPVRLAKGTNTILLTRDARYAELDAIHLSPGRADRGAPVHAEDLTGAVRHEAEEGEVVHAVVRADAGASGGEVVGGLDFPDSSVSVRVWSDHRREAVLGVRFANGSERGGYPLEARHAVTVGGRAAGTIVYPHTRWGNWNVIEHRVRLERGWNTVTLTRLSWYAEIDAIDVR